MTVDELYAQRLRERYAAPAIEVDPEALIRRGRVRRTARWGVGGVAVVAVGVAVGLLLPGRGLGPGPADGAPPPEPPDAEASIWLNAERVPPGADLAVAFVSHSGAQLVGGVGAQVERWDGAAWQPYGYAGLCTDFWQCAGSITRQDEGHDSIGIDTPAIGIGTPDIGVGASVAMRVSTEGLDAGWYRISETLLDDAESPAPADSRRQITAAGIFEVADDAPQPAPLWAPKGAAMISVAPALLTPAGGELSLYPVIPVNADGSQSNEDIAAATDGLSDTARVDRWTDGAWVPVSEVPLTASDLEGDVSMRAAVHALPVGAYRLVRTGPEGDHAGSFWVVDPGPVLIPFKPEDLTSEHLTRWAEQVDVSRTDPDAPVEFTGRTPLPSCGTYVVDQGVDGSAAIPWACLDAGRAVGAELVVAWPTTEGDPIVTYYRTGPGIDRTEAWIDTSEDAFGPQGWQHVTCEPRDGAPRC